MKNKKVVYVLLPATLAVWILIAVRIYNTINPEAEKEAVPVHTNKEKAAEQILSDTFLIDNNYRDPFEKPAAAAVNHNSSHSSPVVKKAARPVVLPKDNGWPLIVYSGMIKNQKSNKQLILVSINGNLRTLKTGDLSDNVLIGKIYKDSIEVVLGKEKRFVRK